MRSYIHQQRCRKQQKEVMAVVEGAQGEAAVGATKEAVTAVAKARGGTNGWGGQQDLLLELLAEGAGGAGGAAGGASAGSRCCSGGVMTCFPH